MPHLDDRQLQQVLENMFTVLKSKGIEISDDNKKTIKDQICEDLYYNRLDHDAIQKTEVQNKLFFCITSLLMGKDDDYKSMMEVLKSDDPKDKELNDKELEKKGKKFNTNPHERLALLALLSFLLDPKNQNENKLTPNEFTRLVLKFKKESKDPEMDEEEKKRQEEENDLAAKQMDACLRNLYGGDNPTISGELDFPIIGPIVGNLFGFTNQTTPDPENVSLMVKAITYNAGPDYLGLEKLIEMQDLGDGIIDNVFTLRPEIH